MAWNELVVNSRYPDFVEELLIAGGAQAVTLTNADDEPLFEPLPGATPLWTHTFTTGLFDASVDLSRIRDFLTQSLPSDDDLYFLEREVSDEDWARAWQKIATALCFGGRLWICPSGQEVRTPDAVLVHLDPGLAFGSGSHPSTALCLEWLAGADLNDTRILDYGCGSGILAVAALQLGARHALATDIDEQALIATFQNASRNDVSHRITVEKPDALMQHEQAFEVIVANILAKPLIDLAPKLSRYLIPGGHIALAGILERQVPEVRDAYESWFQFEPPTLHEGWARLVGERRKC